MRWWLTLATASFLSFFSLVTWSLYNGREPVGVTFETRDGHVFADAVTPGSLAAAAGLQPGDRIVEAAGLPFAGDRALRVFSAIVPVGRPIGWEIVREGRSIALTSPPAGRTPGTIGVLALATLSLALSLALGLVIMWRRHDDVTSLLGAFLLAGIGCASMLVPRSMAFTWRMLPAPAGAVLWIACITSLAVPLLLCVFFARVRRPRIASPLFWIAMAPAAALTAYITIWMALVVYAPVQAASFPLPAWLQIAGPLAYPVYFTGAIVLLATGLPSSDDVTERRRARILLAGTIVGTVGLLGTAVFFAAELQINKASLPFFSASALLFTALPLSFAYATLRYRLFDFRIIVRLGLQYALLRGALLALVPIALALLVIDLVRHGDEPLRQVLLDRGWTYLTVAGLVLVTYTQRRPWMAALDRRFFRERYEAQQVLRRVVEELARATTLDEVADRVLAQITDALHPRRAALLVRAAGADAFEPLAVVPASSSLPRLASTSAIARVACALDKPLTVSTDRGGWRRDLPKESIDWLAAADVELIVPVAMGERHREVLLALGPRLSEEPYSSEDVELLSAIASSLALVGRTEIARTTVPGSPAPSTALSGRYRLERVIGEGGMGTVWEAYDEALNRQVAVKRLKAAAGGGPHEVERFRREAQAAARFAHPNVVVVHDFGIDAHQHPFFVMERLVGRTLRQRLAAEGRLAPAAAGSIVAGAAAGIAAAHAQKLVHRDLKPENVFLCGAASDSAVKILDFGIARSLAFGVTSTRTMSGAIAGTVRYMAPEQLGGGEPSSAWDIWALGVIAYEMLAGAHPLASTDPLACIPALLAGRLQPIRVHVPDAPQAWQAFFDRALALDPAERPTTAIEMADAFAAAIHA